MLVFFDQRSDRFERIFHDAVQCQTLSDEVDSSTGDAGDFHQIVNEPRHLRDLSFDDPACLALDWVLVLLEAQEMHGVGDRCERVAEFMTEHRQELVLAAMKISQSLRLICGLSLQAGARGDVVKAIDRAGNVPAIIPERNNIGDDVNSRAVWSLDDNFHVVYRG